MAGNPGVKFNLPFSIGLPDSAPSELKLKDPATAAVIEQIYTAFQQMQIALHVVLGVGQQLQTQWSMLSPDQTLHLFSPNRIYLIASEAILFGAAINIYDNAGVLTVRNANATNNTKPCHGFCTTAAGIANGAYGESILNFGLLTGVAGLVRGTRYFLSTANGLVTAVAPVAAGNIEQALGLALSSTMLLFNFGFAFVQH